MRLVLNFVCVPSRALTNRLSTFSSKLTLIVFAIREAIRYLRVKMKVGCDPHPQDFE
jgi:hypothetical protein